MPDPGLYVCRRLQNVDQLQAWATEQDLGVLDDDLHVTIVYSRVTIPWTDDQSPLMARVVGWQILGKDNAIVLKLAATGLVVRWELARYHGATWDFASYTPHITLRYLGTDAAPELTNDDLPTFPLLFGPEEHCPRDKDLFNMTDTVNVRADTVKILKTDDEQHMVWGWANVSTQKGQILMDRQNDMIETAELQKAAHDFMAHHRVGGHMHEEMGVGTVVESMVFTEALQKSLGIDLGMEGWLIGVKVHSDKVWKSVKDGTLGFFSIGGSAKRELNKVENA